jgi:hypothetical protein
MEGSTCKAKIDGGPYQQEQVSAIEVGAQAKRRVGYLLNDE